MLFSGLPKLSSPVLPVLKLLGYFAVCLLGAAAWWFVAVNAGARTGTVVLHINEFDQDVVADVGGEVVPISGRTRGSTSLELMPGAYELVIRRGETTLSRESFEVEGGKEVVLTAWQRPAPGSPAATPPDPWQHVNAGSAHRGPSRVARRARANPPVMRGGSGRPEAGMGPARPSTPVLDAG
jgi:hypothetical protein